MYEFAIRVRIPVSAEISALRLHNTSVLLCTTVMYPLHRSEVCIECWYVLNVVKRPGLWLYGLAEQIVIIWCSDGRSWETFGESHRNA